MHALKQELQAKQSLMLEQLHQLCQINSGTANLAGNAAMLKALQDLFQPLADEMQVIALPEPEQITMAGQTQALRCGDALLIRKRPEQKRRVLLTGHMDTVFAVDHPFQSLRWLDDHRINGPGVADMKGGLLVILHALTAFESLPEAENLGWDVLINADEEIGSPASAALLDQLADQYRCGLVYEPAMDDQGTLAKNRKGSGKLTLIAHGRTAHAGRAFDEGRNAIAYLAEAIVAVHKLNGQRPGVTINVGKVLGGEALNVVPDRAVCKLDIRISAPEDEHWVRASLDLIVQALQRPDYHLDIQGSFSRPVKRVSRATERLFMRIQAIGESLGLTIDWKDSGGCCDGNNLAVRGMPVIDTLGVRGGLIHSDKEYIVVDSLPERALLSALILADLARGGLEDLHA